MRALLIATVAAGGCIEPVSLFDGLDSGSMTTDAGCVVGGVSHVSLGWFHGCAVSDGGVYCWGDNPEGALGVGDLQPRLVPTRVGAAADWKEVSVGYDHTCALKLNGEVFCWGSNMQSQLGLGDGPGFTTPQRLTGLSTAAALSVRHGHGCAIVSGGALWCWGENAEGQLGLDDIAPFMNEALPRQVMAGSLWRLVASGAGHTCGIQTDGTLWCWGRNTNRQLGLGAAAPNQIRRPTRVGTASDWLEVSASSGGTCGLRAGGLLFCWGAALGTPMPSNNATPTPVAAALRFTSVSIETFSVCVLEASGVALCWGRNAEGALGTGDTMDSADPVRTDGGPWSQVAMGRFHRCSIDRSAQLWCNGEGAQGRLGLGDVARRRVPVLVPLLCQ